MNLREIYEAHADFVWRTLRRLGVPEEDSKDAVQDVFVSVQTHLHQFEGRSSLSTWIFTICRSVARDRRRRLGRDRERFEDVEVEEKVDLRANVQRSAEHNERVEILEALLLGLEVDQRNVFILFELEKLTGEEISEALDVPLGTVYSRLQAARKAFRQALSRREAGERFSRMNMEGSR
jgi:RNA polymerase sigma-70 factor (ECF subfamily)